MYHGRQTDYVMVIVGLLCSFRSGKSRSVSDKWRITGTHPDADVRLAVGLCYHIQSIHCIVVNISERKSGTDRTKKREFVFFSPPGGATGTVVHRLDATPILPELR